MAVFAVEYFGVFALYVPLCWRPMAVTVSFVRFFTALRVLSTDEDLHTVYVCYVCMCMCVGVVVVSCVVVCVRRHVVHMCKNLFWNCSGK